MKEHENVMSIKHVREHHVSSERTWISNMLFC